MPQNAFLKFVYSEKATKFWEISTLLLSTVHTDKIKVEISRKFVAFSEYMNFTRCLVGSTNQAESSGFYFRIAWKSMKRPSFLWCCSLSFKRQGAKQASFLEVKFIYSEKATKFCEISTLILSVCTVDKSKVEILQIFVAFSEYTNFKAFYKAALFKVAKK